MRVVSKEFVTLLKLREKSFTDRDGKPVTYREFSLLDEEGEILTGTCKATLSLESLPAGEQLRGFAELVITATDPKKVKVQLSSFEAQ